MQLTYRGLAYQVANTCVNTEETANTATYRGQSYGMRGYVNPIFKAPSNLVYRGVSYNHQTTSFTLDSNLEAIPA